MSLEKKRREQRIENRENLGVKNQETRTKSQEPGAKISLGSWNQLDFLILQTINGSAAIQIANHLWPRGITLDFFLVQNKEKRTENREESEAPGARSQEPGGKISLGGWNHA